LEMAQQGGCESMDGELCMSWIFYVEVLVFLEQPRPSRTFEY